VRVARACDPGRGTGGGGRGLCVRSAHLDFFLKLAQTDVAFHDFAEDSILLIF
jgi:hypothetical protein